MERITDFSFSGISDLINGEESVAADVIYQCAIQKEELDAEIEALKKRLRSLEFESESCFAGSKYAVKKLKRDYPIYVKRSDCIVILDGQTIKIERNVV